jgi:ketosteroid isomerase-like protein
MASRDDLIAVIERLHSAQAALYTDGDASGVRELLADNIAWHVPGASPIAGTYRGVDQVIGYMLVRRVLADGTFVMKRLDVLTGSGSVVAVLTDGSASIGGVSREWSTVGLYRVEGERVAECWLLPLDQAEFDDIWTPRRPT